MKQIGNYRIGIDSDRHVRSREVLRYQLVFYEFLIPCSMQF